LERKRGGQSREEIKDRGESGGDKSRRELSGRKLMGVNRGSISVSGERAYAGIC